MLPRCYPVDGKITMEDSYVELTRNTAKIRIGGYYRILSVKKVGLTIAIGCQGSGA